MFCRYGRHILSIAFALLPTLSLAAQSVPSVAVVGTPQSLTLTAADLSSMPRATVTMRNDGMPIVYEGVWISEVLTKAGVRLGESLRGAALASYVIASASDGYQVLFSLGELDPALADNQFLLADKADGKSLTGENGPFRLVIPKDKRAARSVRMLNRLELVPVRK